MSRKWLASGGLAVAALLLFAVEPVAAYNSQTDALISGLNEKLLVVAIPITVLVEGILIYTVLKYRNADEAQPTQENRRLEVTWTIATAVILLFVGFSAFTVLGQESVTLQQENLPSQQEAADSDPGDYAYVHADAEAWAWNFDYPRHNVSSTNTLVIPANQDVYFNITSSDWLHAFHVPALGLKQDAVPGQHNGIMTKDAEVGTYQGYCAEYCGAGHSGMLFTVEVMSQEDYENWLAEQCSGESVTWDNESSRCVAA